jgi:hypothetical protein
VATIPNIFGSPGIDVGESRVTGVPRVGALG